MNWDIIEGKWDGFKADLRQKWGKLTDDDLEQAKGRRDQIVSKIQQRYGETKERVEHALDEMVAKL